MENDNRTDDTDQTYYQNVGVRFEKDDLCKDKDFEQAWKEEVEPVFKSKGLSCELNLGDVEGEMSVSATRLTDYSRFENWDLVWRAGRALSVLSCGLGTEWVEPIVSGHIHVQVVKLDKPGVTDKDDFQSRYDDFIDKFEDKFELSKKLSCGLFYRTTAVLIISNELEKARMVRDIVFRCLFRGESLDELFLADFLKNTQINDD